MNTYLKPLHINRAVLCGTVETAPVPSHTNHDRNFCRFFLSVPRLSGQCDCLPVLAPQQLLEPLDLREGTGVCLTGQLRSYNNKTGTAPRLVLNVLARTITLSEEAPCNVIRLSGTICKTPSYRRTPLGRQICDVILAVNRRYGRADYLPCICWGTVAQQTALLDVGAPLALEGRIQSRTYTKALPDRQTEERTAYEVSVMRPLTGDEFYPPFFDAFPSYG